MDIKNKSKKCTELTCAFSLSLSLCVSVCPWVDNLASILMGLDGRYHGDSNVPGMMDIVIPLHEELERGASTAREESFQASHHGKYIYIYFYDTALDAD